MLSLRDANRYHLIFTQGVAISWLCLWVGIYKAFSLKNDKRFIPYPVILIPFPTRFPKNFRSFVIQ